MAVLGQHGFGICILCVCDAEMMGKAVQSNQGGF